MVEITLLEVHLDGASVESNTTADAVTALPFSSITTGEPEATESETDDAESDATDGDAESRSLAPLVGLVGLVVLVIVLKKVLGGDDADE